MFKPSLAASVAAILLLTACAAPSQPYLDSALNQCNNLGNGRACLAVPALQAQVQAEKNQQAREVGQGFLTALGIVALGALAVVGAAYSPPEEIVVVPAYRYRSAPVFFPNPNRGGR